jgi:Zn-dependent protease with chaperone function
MDEQELGFILGHEMGHVALGHTWLNTILGGMAGIPSPFGAAVILAFAFRWWNRACEFSADRAGLLACGSLQKGISALVKLTMGGQPLSTQAFTAAMARIDAEDDTLAGQLQELMASHPMLIRRINALQAYAATPEYARLQAYVDQTSI